MRILKIVGLIIGGLLLLMVLGGLLLHKSRPSGTEGPEADALARKMIAAVNGAAWDSTEAVQWVFNEGHQHLWDKNRHFARVRWGDHEVLVDINARTGIARTNGEIVSGEAGNKLVQKAWHRWANDSFWLNPIPKAFDNGTERRIVSWEGDPEALMITYTSGGATPGDSYVWRLDDSGRPTHWNMWVNIIPIGGVETSWEGWTTLSTGAEIATLHQLSVVSLAIDDVKGGRLMDLVPEGDPFAELEP